MASILGRVEIDYVREVGQCPLLAAQFLYCMVRSRAGLRLATISAQSASTSRPGLWAPSARPDWAARVALTASNGSDLPGLAGELPAIHHRVGDPRKDLILVDPHNPSIAVASACLGGQPRARRAAAPVIRASKIRYGGLSRGCSQSAPSSIKGGQERVRTGWAA